MDAALYELFWENSKLGPVTLQGFRRRLEQHAATETAESELRYPAAPVPLSRPRDALARATAARRSERAFAEQPLRPQTLGTLFSAFATSNGARA
jgi:hypothetical protein